MSILLNMSKRWERLLTESVPERLEMCGQREKEVSHRATDTRRKMRLSRSNFKSIHSAPFSARAHARSRSMLTFLAEFRCHYRKERRKFFPRA